MAHHQVDFFEIPCTDLAASKAFYAAVFGWSFQDWGDRYADIRGAGLAGGLRPLEEQESIVRSGALIILYSDDLAESERAIVAAGGTVTAHHEFPGGRRFHFLDPSGVELAMWTKDGQ